MSQRQRNRRKQRSCGNCWPCLNKKTDLRPTYRRTNSTPPAADSRTLPGNHKHNRRRQRVCRNFTPAFLCALCGSFASFAVKDFAFLAEILVLNRTGREERKDSRDISRKLLATAFAQSSAKLWRSRCRKLRRELCKSWPEWIWAELPSTTPCWTSRRNSSSRVCSSIQLWRSKDPKSACNKLQTV